MCSDDGASVFLLPFLQIIFGGCFAKGRAGDNGEIAVAETLESTRT